jgi:glycine oxidase
VEHTDVVVIGAGLIGSSIAWRLAQRGRKVILLDRGAPGGEASSAGAGLLQPEAGREAGPQLLGLWVKSLGQYQAFVDEVRETCGAAFEYRTCGRLAVAIDDEGEAKLKAKLAAQRAARIECEWLLGDEIRHIEPHLTPEARCGIHFPRAALVDNQRMAPTLATVAALAGVDVRAYEPVSTVAIDSGRVAGVVTARGRIAADVVVIAAGAWSSQLDPASTETERLERETSDHGSSGPTASPLVRPAKGEIIALWSRTRPIERAIFLDDGSISARSDGRVIVGGTVLDAGFDRDLTAGGVAQLIADACKIVPSLASARFLEAWTGLRPRTPDDQPIVGADPIAGLFWATGHFKTGILAAPATADVVTALVEGRQPPVTVDSLSPRRFERQSPVISGKSRLE